MIGDELVSAYATTNFCVSDGDIEFVLRVGKYSLELEALYRSTGNQQAAYVTAYNPHSKSLTEIENMQRHEALLRRLSNRWPVYNGSGEDVHGEWPPEKSLLILGISLADALSIGSEFAQNAIVYCEQTAIPRLYLCDSNTPIA